MTGISGAFKALAGRNNVVKDRKATRSLQSVAKDLVKNLLEGSVSGGLYRPKNRVNGCKLAAI